jgi:hypothetical protein
MPAPGYVPVSGAQLLVKDPGDPSRRSVKVRSVDPEIGNGINTVINPAADGAFLHVFNSNGTGDSACFSLPASGWVSIGTPEDPLYVYRDVAHANGPCSVARIRRNKYFRVTCRAASQPIPYTLDEAAQGSVASALTIGPATYCTDFGGAVLLDDGATGRFKAKLAPAPAACPVAPAPCP